MIYLIILKSYCLAVCCRAHRIKEWESSQISNFTEKDMVSAMRKLEDAAFKWDHTNYIESMYVKGFEVYLTPYDFKQQIERSFKIRLTGAEVLFARYYLELYVTGSPLQCTLCCCMCSDRRFAAEVLDAPGRALRGRLLFHQALLRAAR